VHQGVLHIAYYSPKTREFLERVSLEKLCRTRLVPLPFGRFVGIASSDPISYWLHGGLYPPRHRMQRWLPPTTVAFLRTNQYTPKVIKECEFLFSTYTMRYLIISTKENQAIFVGMVVNQHAAFESYEDLFFKVVHKGKEHP